MHEHWSPKRGHNYYYFNNLLETSVLFKLFLITICYATIEFSIMYTIFSDISHWYIPVIQIGLWVMTRLLTKYFKDPLFDKLIWSFLICLSMIVIYLVNNNCNSFFFYNMFRFLRTPFQFRFIEGNGYLEICFYYIFSLYIYDIITTIIPDVYLIRKLSNLKKLFTYCWF